ncbi:UDP-N-acetylenolpyruvoylglucosamine reductase [Spirochaetia bacterium]|nr:UDP-N-acetylenolpyruvoylglucosamine reductase [Spirochaetia bacterium]
MNDTARTSVRTLRAMVEAIAAETDFSGDIRSNEPMAAHTTFKVGGPADIWVRPSGGCFPGFAAALLLAARVAGIPLFVLGGGANLVVSDAGIRGIVLDTSGWTGAGVAEDPCRLLVRSGTAVDDAVEAAAERGLGGLEFLAGMPGAIGGAVWMNARCYERQVSDLLIRTEILDLNPLDDGPRGCSFRRVWVPCDPGEFSYKRSPFQRRDALGFSPLILNAEFRLEKREVSAIRQEMAAHKRDREEKGHYRYPSAGSVFKNSRDLGKPTGKIIDELGLRGYSVGGAQVAPWHGNIIINTGNASAADIRELTERVAEKVRSTLGFELEPEIIFAGGKPYASTAAGASVELRTSMR